MILIILQKHVNISNKFIFFSSNATQNAFNQFNNVHLIMIQVRFEVIGDKFQTKKLKNTKYKIMNLVLSFEKM